MSTNIKFTDHLLTATDLKPNAEAHEASTVLSDSLPGTAIGDHKDNSYFKVANLSDAELKKLGFNDNFSISGISSAKPGDGIKIDPKDGGQSAGNASPIEGITPSGDVVWKSPTDGWDQTGPNSWDKTTPLPKNWDSMTPGERAGFIDKINKDFINDWSMVDPGGGVKTGWHRDPHSGEAVWVGYVGEEPKGPAPKGGNPNYYL